MFGTRRQRPQRASRTQSVDAVASLVWQITAMQLPEPEREVTFHPTRKWRFDLCWRDRKVAVEVEGGLFGERAVTAKGVVVRVGGRHNRGKGFEDDCIKYSEAAILGWAVIRVTTKMVTDGRAIALVARALGDERA